MLTESQLRRIMPNLPGAKAQLFLPHLNQAMSVYGIHSMIRTAAFVAQLAHESGELRWMEEIWGPTAAQRRYEPPSDLATRLGNRLAGDGKRFKGRGPIQITGRFNYGKFGGLLGMDLVSRPDLAATPEVAFRVAGLYWKSRGLNELADLPDFKEITRRINGGFNGLPDRQKYFDRAREVLALDFVVGPLPRGAAEAAVIDEPLERGAEAIRELAPARKRAAPRKQAAKKAAKKAGTKAGTKATKKVAAKVAAKKAPASKVPGKKTPAKKTPARKTPEKKTPAKKTPAKKTPARKTPARKSSAKTAAAR